MRYDYQCDNVDKMDYVAVEDMIRNVVIVDNTNNMAVKQCRCDNKCKSSY